MGQQTRPLSRDPAFTAVLGSGARPLTSLVFANLAALIGAGQQTGLTTGSLGARLMPDLRRITGVGLTSTRGASDSTTQVLVAVKP